MLKTRIYTTDCQNPHQNLALEDMLLRTLPKGEAILFLWQNRHTVVIGAGQNAWRECHTALLEQESGILARRSSGGGAVYHDLGNLNFSFIMPQNAYDVARQMSVVLNAVRALGINAEASGRNDLCVDGRKFSGNAFRVLKDSALHHGTLLVSADMNLIGRYLSVPSDKLKAKGVKSIPARVVNLSEFRAITTQDMHSAMIDAFRSEYSDAPVEDVNTLPLQGLDECVQRFASWEWNFGESPKGEWTLNQRFEWGALELVIDSRAGRIESIAVYTDAMDETLHARLKHALAGCPLSVEPIKARCVSLGRPDIGEWLASCL